MFAAIRDYFARPDEPRPLKGRGRRVTALFLFEFVVVVLGVLAAQLLQDYFATRGEARRAREAMATAGSEFQILGAIAEYRVRANACESKRIARLVELATNGGAASDSDRAPPIMPMPIVTPWSNETRSAVLRHFGSERLQTYDGLALLASMMSERQRLLEDQWADFRLLSPEMGPMTEGRRTAVLLAASRVGGLLNAIDMNALRVREAAPPSPQLGEMLKRTAAMNHPCASAALVPYEGDRK